MSSGYGRAMVLVTGSSMLVPVIGLATAPILAHALGVEGRGEAGAAMAPNLLIAGGATLGLANALTFYLAKRPDLTRVALGWASLVTLALGGVTLVGVVLTRNYLSGGDPALAHLMLVGAWFALPTLLVGLLRGAATGRQMWGSVATERVVTSVVRLILLGGLAWTGRLNVTSAVVVMCAAPVLAAVSYWRVLAAPWTSVADADDRVSYPVDPGEQPRVPVDLLTFGSQVWLGSVATMLMARMSQLLVVPLSDTAQLGLLIVAITISDVPYIVTQTVREVAFGANSAVSDTERLLATSRIATLAALAGSLVLGGTLPWWIGFVFGDGFEAAILPTWLLLLASCASVPGLIAGAGLDSAGRPALRSFALVLGLITAVVGLVVFVPPWGATGGALSALVSTAASSLLMVLAAGRLLEVRSFDFFALRRQDLSLLTTIYRSAIKRLRPARAAR